MAAVTLLILQGRNMGARSDCPDQRRTGVWRWQIAELIFTDEELREGNRSGNAG